MFPLDARALANLAGTYANDETSAAVVPSGAGLSLDVVENGVLTSVEARPIGERTFEIVGGDLGRHRFDFPLPRFLRYGSRLLERTS
jgi:hypothetical protein